MSTRVNLLRREEMRREGVVSPGFLLRVAVGTGLALLALFGVLSLLQYRNARERIRVAREIWAAREPELRRVQKMKADLAAKRGLDQELRGWVSARVDWAKPLRALQENVPAVVQLRKLDIRGDAELRTEKTTPAKGSGERRSPTGIPGRRYFLAIEGRAFGDKAEDAVLEFEAALRRSPEFRTLLSSIKLQRLQSEREVSGTEGGRTFLLEAATGRREMQ